MKTGITVLTIGLFCGFNSFGVVYYLNSSPGPYPFDPYGGNVPVITLDASNQVYLVADTPEDAAALHETYHIGADIASTSADMEMNSPAADDFISSGFRLNISRRMTITPPSFISTRSRGRFTACRNPPIFWTG